MIDSITVDKTDLLKILNENRAKHRAVFDAAIAGYRADAIHELNNRITLLEKGKSPKLGLGMVVPQDHTRDYDRVIRMVTMHQGDTIELNEGTFAMYVEDDWSWKREFLGTSMAYAAGATIANYGGEADF